MNRYPEINTEAELSKYDDGQRAIYESLYGKPTQTRRFFISVHTYPNFGYTGFVIIESTTMYAAWCEALRTLRLEDFEYITVTPWEHLPANVQKYATEATPRQVVV